jgi:hypothetical protein
LSRLSRDEFPEVFLLEEEKRACIAAWLFEVQNFLAEGK